MKFFNSKVGVFSLISAFQLFKPKVYNFQFQRMISILRISKGLVLNIWKPAGFRTCDGKKQHKYAYMLMFIC